MAEDTAETTPGVPERGARRRRKTAAEPAAPACAMSIHAHPDDQEFTVGGTLAVASLLGRPASESGRLNETASR